MDFRVSLILAASVCLAQARAEDDSARYSRETRRPKPTVTVYIDDAGLALPSLPRRGWCSRSARKITAAELEAIIDCLPEGVRGKVRGPGRREFAENLARLKALAKEARRRGLDRTPVYNAQIGFQTANLLAGLFYQTLVKTAAVEESAARAFYEQHKADWERLRGRHILIRFQGSRVPVRPGQNDITEQEAFAKAQVLANGWRRARTSRPWPRPNPTM